MLIMQKNCKRRGAGTKIRSIGQKMFEKQLIQVEFKIEFKDRFPYPPPQLKTLDAFSETVKQKIWPGESHA